MWITFAILILVAFVAYVRFSANDPARWHVDVPTLENKTFAGGAIRVAPGGPDDLARLHEVIIASGAHPIAGQVPEGHVTYISRSKVVGFPDFTTVQLKDGQIAVYGRLRFGKSDMKVNKTRIDGWLKTLAEQS